MSLKKQGVQIAIASIVYGIWNLTHTHIINDAQTYESLRMLTSAEVIGWLFIVSGSVKLLGHYFGYQLAKRLGISLIIGAWTLVEAGLIIQRTNSTPIVLIPIILIWCFNIALANY